MAEPNIRPLNRFTKERIESAVSVRPNPMSTLAKMSATQQAIDDAQQRTVPDNYASTRSQVSAPPSTFTQPNRLGQNASTPFEERQATSPNSYDYGLDPAPYQSPFEGGYNTTPPVVAGTVTGPTMDRPVTDRTGNAVQDAADEFNRMFGDGAGLSPEAQREFDRMRENLEIDSARALQDQQIALADLERQKGDLFETYGIKSPYLDAAIERETARWELTQQELALRAKKATRDLEKARKNEADTIANRAAIAGAYGDYRDITAPLFQKAIAEAGLLYEKSAPGSIDIQSREVEKLAELTRDGVDISMGKGIEDRTEITDAAFDALLEESNFGLEYHIDNASNRGEADKRILRATEGVAVTDAVYGDAADAAANARRAQETDAVFDVRQEDALATVLAAVEQQRQGDLDLQQAELGHQGNMANLNENRDLLDLGLNQNVGNYDARISQLGVNENRILENLIQGRLRLGEDEETAKNKALAEFTNMDAGTFGEMSAVNALDNALGNDYDPARRAIVEGEFGDLLSSGIVDAAQLPALFDLMRAEGENPLTSQEERALIAAMEARSEGMDTWNSGTVQDSITNPVQTTPFTGTADRPGAGQKAGGEAFANIQNRDNPVYKERASFVSQNKKQIMSQFGLTDWGQWRDVSAEVNENRSPNSDHYSGGANDYYSPDRQKMEAAQAFLENQPYVSFTRLHMPGPHLHVSYRLGS